MKSTISLHLQEEDNVAVDSTFHKTNRGNFTVVNVKMGSDELSLFFHDDDQMKEFAADLMKAALSPRQASNNE